MERDGTLPENLTPKQARFLAALLTEPTVEEAARKATVAHTTAYRWLREAPFRATYRTARREAVLQATAQLQAATGKAVRTLVGVLDDPAALASAKVAAARTILEGAGKGVELEDLADRLTQLEHVLTEIQAAGEPAANGKPPPGTRANGARPGVKAWN